MRHSERRWGRPVKQAAPSWRCEHPDRKEDRPAAAVHSWIRLSTSISLPLSLKIVFSVSSRHVKHCSALEDRGKLTWCISACCLLTDRTWSSFYALHIWQEGTGWRRTVHVCARWYTCTNTLTFLQKMDWEENNPPTAIIHCLWLTLCVLRQQIRPSTAPLIIQDGFHSNRLKKIIFTESEPSSQRNILTFPFLSL